MANYFKRLSANVWFASEGKNLIINNTGANGLFLFWDLAYYNGEDAETPFSGDVDELNTAGETPSTWECTDKIEIEGTKKTVISDIPDGAIFYVTSDADGGEGDETDFYIAFSK